MPNEVNFFGNRIYQINEVANDPAMQGQIKQTLGRMLAHVGFPKQKETQFISEFIALGRTYKSLQGYEYNAYHLFQKYNLVGILNKALKSRTELIFEQLKPHAAGSILDLGCNEGGVGNLFSKDGHFVSLADIFKHPQVKRTKLPFYLIPKTGKLKIHPHDTTIIATVLHHSDDPRRTLQNAINATKKGGTILVIESVHGLSPESGNASLPSKTYSSLTKAQQLKRLQYFDHMWNRILNYHRYHDRKINVPNNHGTIKAWSKLFSSMGLETQEITHLGVDQPTSPEYHVLFKLKRI